MKFLLDFQFLILVLVFLVLVLIWGHFVKKGQSWGQLNPEKESILITGCDSGIGQQLAAHFGRLGFRVFAGCLSASGQGAAQLLRETQNVTIVQLDITDDRSVKEAYRTVAEQTQENGLWGLVNNAGVMCYGEFEWLTWKQCQKQIEVNLTGTIRVTRTFLELIRKRKGRIVTMSSVNGLLSYPAQSVYCATKFALEGFQDSLRLELLKSGVRVVSVRLGDFARLTDIFSKHAQDVRDMWEDMDEERRKRVGDYFWKFHEVASAKHGLTSPPSFRQSRLFADLRHALMDRRPNHRYLCMPFSQKLAVWLYFLLPATVSDRMLAFIFGKVFEHIRAKDALT